MSSTSQRAPALAAFSHGTSSPVGQKLVIELMAAVAEARPVLETRLGYVDVQQPDIDETFASLDRAAPTVVVPLLLSAGYHVHVDLTTGVARREGPTVLAGALGPDTRLAQVLAQRLTEAGLTDDDVVVLAVAGSSDTRAVADCEVVREQLADASGHAVTLGFLSAAEPRLADAIRSAREEHPDARIVASSYLLAPGYFHDLVGAAGADLVTAPLLAEGEAPPAELVEIVLDRYDAVAR